MSKPNVVDPCSWFASTTQSKPEVKLAPGCLCKCHEQQPESKTPKNWHFFYASPFDMFEPHRRLHKRCKKKYSSKAYKTQRRARFWFEQFLAQNDLTEWIGPIHNKPLVYQTSRAIKKRRSRRRHDALYEKIDIRVDSCSPSN
jgi:hypothetical protein